MTKLQDNQRLEIINALMGFKLKKLTKRIKTVQGAIPKAQNYYKKKKIEKELLYLTEERDHAANLLTLTFD